MKGFHLIRLALAWGLVFSAAAQVDAPTEDAAFQTFLGEVRGAALERGIRAETLDAVLPSISIHRQAVAQDRAQAEFVQTY